MKKLVELYPLAFKLVEAFHKWLRAKRMCVHCTLISSMDGEDRDWRLEQAADWQNEADDIEKQIDLMCYLFNLYGSGDAPLCLPGLASTKREMLRFVKALERKHEYIDGHEKFFVEAMHKYLVKQLYK
jgi:hypothetical protein